MPQGLRYSTQLPRDACGSTCLHVNEVDRRYEELLNTIFAEVEERVPGYATFSRINGILISSPGAQVYYHFDACGQSLWQIEGKKRVYLYPPVSPFLTPENMEHVAVYRDEVGIAYEPWFDGICRRL